MSCDDTRSSRPRSRIGLGGCASFRDLFSAHADVAAEAGGQQLSAAAPRPDSELGREGGQGRPRDRRIRRQHLGGLRPAGSGGGAREAAGGLRQRRRGGVAGNLRAQGHALARHADGAPRPRWPTERSTASTRRPIRGSCSTSCSVPGPGPTPRRKPLSRRRPRRRWRRSGRGPSFDQLAFQLSEDPGSKADSGYLPPSPKGRFVPAFDSVGWLLKPGEVSGWSETPFGFHIIKRPTFDEARRTWSAFI